MPKVPMPTSPAECVDLVMAWIDKLYRERASLVVIAGKPQPTREHVKEQLTFLFTALAGEGGENG